MNILPMHLKENKDDKERRRRVYSKYHPALLNNIIWETSVEERGELFLKHPADHFLVMGNLNFTFIRCRKH